MELAERDQVVDAVLAATKPLGCVGHVQPGGRCRRGRDQRGGPLSDLGKLLVGEPDGQLDHRWHLLSRLADHKGAIRPSLLMTVRTPKRPTTFAALATSPPLRPPFDFLDRK